MRVIRKRPIKSQNNADVVLVFLLFLENTSHFNFYSNCAAQKYSLCFDYHSASFATLSLIVIVKD